MCSLICIWLLQFKRKWAEKVDRAIFSAEWKSPFKARFPLTYFDLVVLSCRQRKVKQKMKIFNDWTGKTSIFSDAWTLKNYFSVKLKFFAGGGGVENGLKNWRRGRLRRRRQKWLGCKLHMRAGWRSDQRAWRLKRKGKSVVLICNGFENKILPPFLRPACIPIV